VRTSADQSERDAVHVWGRSHCWLNCHRSQSGQQLHQVQTELHYVQ